MLLILKDILTRITSSAVALSKSVKDGLGSLWQHGKFNTSQLRNLSSYDDETVQV